MTTTSPFQQLLRAAALEAEPQRLLFVFACAELPDDASPAQRERFAAGHGGALVPTLCVDKMPSELHSFEALRAESAQAGPAWQVAFIAALAGRAGKPPDDQQTEKALKALVERVRTGQFQGLLALDPDGQLLHFD